MAAAWGVSYAQTYAAPRADAPIVHNKVVIRKEALAKKVVAVHRAKAVPSPHMTVVHRTPLPRKVVIHRIDGSKTIKRSDHSA